MFDEGDPQWTVADFVLADRLECARSRIDAIGGQPAGRLADRIDKATTRIELEETRGRFGGIVAYRGQCTVIVDGEMGECIMSAVGAIEVFAVGGDLMPVSGNRGLRWRAD